MQTSTVKHSIRLSQRKSFGISAVLALALLGGAPTVQDAHANPNAKNISETKVSASQLKAPSETNSTDLAPLGIAFLYVSPIGDGAWTAAHDKARLILEETFGRKIATTYVENVPESNVASLVIRDFVASGNRLVFGTSFGYMDHILKNAPDFSNVKFEHLQGYKRTVNMRTYDARSYESSYLAGIIAGNTTKTNVLGVVASIPIPEVFRNINSFTLGAQSVNPRVKTHVVWINSWFDPPRESKAASDLINAGADVLYQNTDSHAVLQTAETKGIRAFGWNSDMAIYAPKAHLASAVINWAPYYIKTTQDVLNGTWASEHNWWGIKEGAVDVVSIATDVSPETKNQLEKVKQGIKDGSFIIWKGPIIDNVGEQRLTPNGLASDQYLSEMNYFVAGVVEEAP